ncbi:MAG TPA: apolipoprotein N-acyltransferase [Candidatus Acidoferrum sp.]|nr:apolipoprotein N-acyltransferase [Candidatus Acidoferrum sp.]
MSAAFPDVGLAGAAWVGPGLILFSGLGCGGGRAFRLGFAGGLAHYLSSLYWLLAIPDTFHGIPIGPGFAWLLLSGYCAIFPGLWVWLGWRIWAAPAGPELPARAALDQFFSAGVLRRGLWAFNTGLLWVALEMARGRLFSGFPWNSLGASQYKMLPLIQMATVTGVYGVSFLVVWMSVALVMALVSLTRRPGRGVWGEAGVPLLTVVVVASIGAGRVAKMEPAGETLAVALAQPAFAQTTIWNQAEDEARMRQMLALSEEALAEPARLLIWPEGAMSSLTPEHLAALAGLTTRHGVWLMATADLSEDSARGAVEDFNSSFLMNPRGELAAVYHKRRLVIFGEYVPGWLAFLKWVTPIDGSFTSGKEAVQFAVKNPAARFSALICFEDAFAEEAREHVAPETDFLVNLTNDGWFGKGPAQWQQAAAAVFRAVENGVPLVRCTNDGVTCWIDAQGRLREIFSVAGNVYKAGFMRANIPLRARGEGGRTFYNLHGDWFGWSCCGMSLCLCAATLRRRETVQ